MADINEAYKYKLQYQYNDVMVTYEFNADVDVTKMADHLRDFLCGCGWYDCQVKDILKLEEE